MKGFLGSVILCLLVAGVVVGSPAGAQYIYADSNGDARSTSVDVLKGVGPTTVVLWLVTDRTRDGSPVPPAVGSGPRSIFSYEFVLAAVGGTVQWREYTNLLPGAIFPLNRAESPTELAIAYGGVDPLPPGRYKLGSLSVEVKSGDPRLEFRSKGTVERLALTAFGSKNRGKDGDNTLKYTEDRSKLGNTTDEPGDWADADGIASPSSGTLRGAGMETRKELRFGVQVVRNARSGSDVQLLVTTTRTGYLRVRLFDLQGRLVGTLANEQSVGPGAHTVNPTASSAGRRSLANGVYFYRVETTEATRTGRVAIIK